MITAFKFVEFSTLCFRKPFRRGPWGFYHRLANAGRLQVGPLILSWPLPWAACVRDEVGYGRGRPSGVRSALGWRQPR